MAVFARRPKKVVVITKWPYYRGGLKAGYHCSGPCVNKGSPHLRESKTVLDSGFQIPGTGFQIFVSGTWIPYSNLKWDSGFLELHSGFPSPWFRIPPAPDKIAEFRTPDSRFQIPIPFHSAKRPSRYTSYDGFSCEHGQSLDLTIPITT